MTERKSFSLGKTERLKSRKQIDALFQTGKKMTVFPFRVMYRKEPGNSGLLQAGFTVSSKMFPRAVDRNRIKRLTREGYRVQKQELEFQVVKNNCLLDLFFIYTGRDIIPYSEIASSLKQVLSKLTAQFHESDTKNT